VREKRGLLKLNHSPGYSEAPRAFQWNHVQLVKPIRTTLLATIGALTYWTKVRHLLAPGKKYLSDSKVLGNSVGDLLQARHSRNIG